MYYIFYHIFFLQVKMIIKNYSLNPNSFNICKTLPIPSIVPAKVDCTYGNKKGSDRVLLLLSSG
jgi:hypothetical protein